MNKIIKVWNYIDGKKTSFAAAYWLLSSSIVPIWFPDGTPGVTGKVITTVGIILTSVGLGHKIVKVR